MKKLLFFFALLFMGAMTAFAQVPANEQLTYQTVVRNAQNQLVFSQDNVSVTVEVCNADGSVVRYSETHTGLSTNANGLLTLMVGGGTLVSGEWGDIDWTDASIKTVISYDPGTGTVTITSDPAPISAVPYALSAGNMSNITNIIGDAIHDSIVNNINNNVSEQIHDSIVYNINNNISEQIHDSVSNYLTNNHYVTETDLCTTIETNCDNVALRNGNTFTGGHNFTGASSVTVPNAITPDLATTLASACTKKAVNLCDLLAVFDSLNRRINSVYDSLQRLNDELTALKNTIPPVTSAPTVSNVTSTSMNVKANATSDGAAITSYEFCISTSSDMNGATCQTVQASDADNYTFTGLTPNTNYYVQYKATNFAGTTTSSSVQQRTPAHAPTATVNTPESTKPAGFKVEVIDIDPKEKDDATTVQVCYTEKTGGECPEKESADYSGCKNENVTGDAVTVSVAGLTPATEYCAIVKVSNGDSTTIYGPYTVTTGDDVTLTVTRDPSTATVSLCGASTADVTFTATPSDGGDYTYSWSTGSSATNTNTVALGSGSHTVNVTATHTTEGYTVTGAASVTVSSGGTAVSLGLCEWDGLVTVKTVGGSPNSIDWGDGSTPYSGTVTANSTSNTYAASGSYDIIATNASGCRAKVTMQVNVPGGTAASRTVKPCTVGDGAHTGAEYSGTGHGGANYGFETANGEGKITSVTDYDGNEYPVVQIGSQCWMAENLRCTHSPKTGSNLVGTAVTNSYGSKLALWYNYDESTYTAKRYGILYNWCAAMDTANPGSGNGGSGTYVEVVASGNNNNSSFNFTPSGNHQGVCPLGWHMPTDAEWNAMEATVSDTLWQSSYETTSGSYRGSHAGKLSTGCDWTNSSTANAAGNYSNAERNASGFSAVPAGYFSGSSFYYSGLSAYFWSASQYNSLSAWSRLLSYSNAGVGRYNRSKYYGFSVRCVRD